MRKISSSLEQIRSHPFSPHRKIVPLTWTMREGREFHLELESDMFSGESQLYIFEKTMRGFKPITAVISDLAASRFYWSDFKDTTLLGWPRGYCDLSREDSKRRFTRAGFDAAILDAVFPPQAATEPVAK